MDGEYELVQLIPLQEMRSLRFPRNRSLPCDRTRIMAIVNITPDSFSGDGQIAVEQVLHHARQAIADGASILDLGAESTRPGARKISAEEELARLLPAVRAVREIFPEVILSIDTTKADVFRAAHSVGGDILNSVAGFSEELAAAACDTGCTVVISNPGGAGQGSPQAVFAALHADAQLARRFGIATERILLDPGIGFGKTPDENICLLKHLAELVALGYPTLLGVSRKSTLGYLTGNPVERREFATSATTTMAALAKIDFVRVHDVAAAAETLAVANAVAWDWRPDTWSQ